MKLGIFIAMLTAVRNPLVTAAIANGHLKKYQLVVNGILIMVAPLLYIVFRSVEQPKTIRNIQT